MPLLARDALGLGEHRLAQPGALQLRTHRKHAEIPRIADVIAALGGHVRAGQKLAIALPDQDHAAIAIDAGGDVVCAGAAPVEQVGLGGPADPACITPVGRFDQRHQRVDIIVSGGPELQMGIERGGHASSLRTLTSAATKASISSKVL